MPPNLANARGAIEREIQGRPCVVRRKSTARAVVTTGPQQRSGVIASAVPTVMEPPGLPRQGWMSGQDATAASTSQPTGMGTGGGLAT